MLIDILQKTYPKRRPGVSRSSTLVTEITARSAWTSTVSITVTAESPLSVKARCGTSSLDAVWRVAFARRTRGGTYKT